LGAFKFYQPTISASHPLGELSDSALTTGVAGRIPIAIGRMGNYSELTTIWPLNIEERKANEI